MRQPNYHIQHDDGIKECMGFNHTDAWSTLPTMRAPPPSGTPSLISLHPCRCHPATPGFSANQPRFRNNTRKIYNRNIKPIQLWPNPRFYPTHTPLRSQKYPSTNLDTAQSVRAAAQTPVSHGPLTQPTPILA